MSLSQAATSAALKQWTRESLTATKNLLTTKGVMTTPCVQVPMSVVQPALAEEEGSKLVLKMEQMQVTGSFKIRGAMNAVLALTNEEAKRGVICHSAGNHGVALACAARQRGAKCLVVVPDTAPQAKVEAIRNFGSEVAVAAYAQRAEFVETLAAARGSILVHPFDDDLVIEGQSTMAVEMVQQTPDMDVVLVPISGGGMAAGIAKALSILKPSIKIVLVEPKGKNLAECFRQNDRLFNQSQQPLNTIADGMRSGPIGQKPFDILKSLNVTSVISVDDEAILKAMTTLFSAYKLCVEPAGATALAAIQATHPDLLKEALGENASSIGAIICGGNLDIEPILRNAFHNNLFNLSAARPPVEYNK